jgi:lysyl-tRNA synthetase class I
MSSKQAQMLALCHERLFVTGSVPSTSVSNVSITTLYLMASADDKKRKEMVAACVAAGGSGFTEKQARDIRNRGKNLKKVIDLTSADIAKKVTDKAKDMSKEELVEALIKAEQDRFENIMKCGQYRAYSKKLVEVMKKEKLEIPSLPDANNFSPVDDKDLPEGLK